jgi:hypothetical protein
MTWADFQRELNRRSGESARPDDDSPYPSGPELLSVGAPEFDCPEWALPFVTMRYVGAGSLTFEHWCPRYTPYSVRDAAGDVHAGRSDATQEQHEGAGGNRRIGPWGPMATMPVPKYYRQTVTQGEVFQTDSITAEQLLAGGDVEVVE